MVKMNDMEEQLGHSNIVDVVLKRIIKHLGKKTKHIIKEEKEQYERYFENKKGVFIIEKLAPDAIECCKLPDTNELRKKLGYNYDDIMIREEPSIAEKIIKLFLNQNIALNKKFNGRKLDIWFKDYDCAIEVDRGNHENYDTDDEKQREETFKRHNFKMFR